MEYVRAGRDGRRALLVSHPLPVNSPKTLRASIGQAANIGIFLLLFGAFIYISGPILLPLLSAAVIATTLAPLVRAARRYGIAPWLSGIVIIVIALGALGFSATVLAAPVGEWIARAPEIRASLKSRLTVLDEPLTALHNLENSLFGSTRPINQEFAAQSGCTARRSADINS